MRDEEHVGHGVLEPQRHERHDGPEDAEDLPRRGRRRRRVRRMRDTAAYNNTSEQKVKAAQRKNSSLGS